MSAPQRTQYAGLTIAERRALLVLGDVACAVLAAAVALAAWVVLDRAFSDPFGFLASRDAWAPILLLFPLWFFLIAYLYDPHVAFSAGRTAFGLVLAVGVSLVPYMAVYFLAVPGTLPRLVVVILLVGLGAITMIWRLIAIRLFTLPAFQRPVLIIGAGFAGREILKVLRQDVPGHYRVAGLIDDDPAKRGAEWLGCRVLGGWETLNAIIAEGGVSTLILSITGDLRAEMVQAILQCQEAGVQVVRMPTLYEELLGRVPIQHLQADWLVTSFLDTARLFDLYGALKRLMDVAGGLIGVLIGLLLTPLIALLIRIDSPGPIIYMQERLGKGGRPFRVIKFRTMIPEAEADGRARWATRDDPRITRLGRWLRRTRTDEIPQFWNVLRGEMSLIGPRAERPEIVTEIERQVPFYRARLLVRPGLTGWSQVNFGYGRTVEDTVLKTEYDLYYIRHRSFWLDLKILLRTVDTVLRMQGA